jgi:hypothetical protein
MTPEESKSAAERKGFVMHVYHVPPRAVPKPVDGLTNLARVLYLVSLLLLVTGAWVLIDPFHRQGGRTSHIYITLVAFELYMWLLLLLGRWQCRKDLTGDTARGGLFVLFLLGLLFMAINELHMAAPAQGPWATVAAVVLAGAKLAVAPRWLGVPMPRPFAAACGAWLLTLAVPGVVIESLAPDYAAQHVAGYFCCWAVAIVFAGHLALVGWQRRRGWGDYVSPHKAWWSPWLILFVLGVLFVLQLYATMWGLFVEWARWFFSPVYLAGAIGVFALCIARRAAGWFALFLAIFYAGVVSIEPLPGQMPLSWSAPGAIACTTVYGSAVFGSLLLAVVAAVLWRLWPLILALAGPVAAGTVKVVTWLLSLAYGVGLAILGASFLLLGAGAAVQWWRERHRALEPSPVPIPIPPRSEGPLLGGAAGPPPLPDRDEPGA